MNAFTHHTAPTRYVEANGIRFAYRRFGKSSGVPIVFNQHYTGTMDYWDPAVTDGLAETREVILFNNAGVSSSSGETPASFPEMGANAIAFIRALGLHQVDVLGISIGGFVAQEIALQGGDLVRKLILVGTGHRGNDMTASRSAEIFAGRYEPPEHLWLSVHFAPSDASQKAGIAFLQRKWHRKDRDPEASAQTVAAQGAAIGKWIAPDENALAYLKSIRQPTLIVQGSNDAIIPTAHSVTLQQHLPNAQLVIYPDAGHGSIYQYPERFVAHAIQFLNEGPAGMASA
ncbi:MAG: alpha/beta fold hydrolase [Burkholderia contaminans]|jgi:pimeloyl-ACP methyl ester carboxylesterase|uniref:Alpha/beta hydrolase n=1 Tax=Burkholderia contaminans TaxID=488447 RepID=A0AAP4QYZ7_9BURK|nr:MULTISPECIES: alpha/beta hydrolase [Burkholderia]MBD1410617.1 alpha/beta hydrolase [Burkholderia contaminans]MBH9668062.1 alpha/beta hydrolase [Burkholderia contaminans]MBH9678229.1 alpha/beta hydrolase [Burkholderia contaminans]MBH9705342.1 alpha/beta hydrolase [Burkholderia contaminans]MBH9721852.1 alpha/beta hydrolase [Burkholderia contaminans]